MTRTFITPTCIFAVLLLSARPAISQPTDDFLAAARNQCQSYGFQLGSDGLARCVQGFVDRANQSASDEEDRYNAIKLCESQMWFDPSGNGTLGGALANVAKCNSDPQAHLRQRQDRGYTCQRGFFGSVSCVPNGSR